MRLRIRSLMGLAALLVLITAMAAAQSSNVFTCSSDDGRLHSCRVNTNAPIQFVRQRSDAQCIAGQTYGIDRGGVWVTNGCRADFAVGARGAYDQGAYNNGNRDRDNDADDQDNGNWRHHHRRDNNDNGSYSQNGPYNNGSYDRQGNYQGPYNNGRYNNGDRGYVNSGQPIQYYGSYKNGRTNCSANPGAGQTYCQTGGALSDATIIKQNGRCQRGQNWDINPDGLWIADGCSAEFQLQR